jgi:hypothetical protein
MSFSMSYIAVDAWSWVDRVGIELPTSIEALPFQ